MEKKQQIFFQTKKGCTFAVRKKARGVLFLLLPTFADVAQLARAADL